MACEATAPAVSVVMPVYNGERFVAEAIGSVLAQTFRDFECIVVDDGSRDGTARLLAEATAKDPRVRVLSHQQNVGFRRALNSGCDIARGEFVARLDADDVCLPQRFERQVAYLKAHPDVAVVGSWVQLVDDRGVRGRVQRYPTQPAMVSWSMLFFNSLAHPSVMIRRSALQAAGGFPDGCEGGTEDYALFLQLSRTTRLANLSEVLLLYRMWPGSMSKTSWERQERDAVRLLRDHADRHLGIALSPDEASALRGLSRDAWPASAAEGEALARLVNRLARVCAPRLPASEGGLILNDAGIRTWLLAAVAARRAAVAPSLRMAAMAFRTSPSSLPAFLAKVARRISPRSA